MALLVNGSKKYSTSLTFGPTMITRYSLLHTKRILRALVCAMAYFMLQTEAAFQMHQRLHRLAGAKV